VAGGQVGSGSVPEEKPPGVLDEGRAPAWTLLEQLDDMPPHRVRKLQPVPAQLDPWRPGLQVHVLSFDAGDPGQVLSVKDHKKACDANVRGNAFFVKEPVRQVGSQLVVLDIGRGLRRPHGDGGCWKVDQMLADCPEQELPGPVAGAGACQPLIDIGPAEPGQSAPQPDPGHQFDCGA